MSKFLHQPIISVLVLFPVLSFQAVADTSGSHATANRGTHQLAVALTKMGAFRCVERANQVGHFLSGGGGGEVILVDLPGRSPASDLIHATMLVPTEKNALSSVEITLAPTASSCQASYEATTQSTEPCNKTIKQEYPRHEFTEIKKTGVLIASLGKHSRVMAKPVGKGCMLVKHEMIH